MGCGNSSLEELEIKLTKCDEDLVSLTQLQEKLESQLDSLRAESNSTLDLADFTSQIQARATAIEKLLDEVNGNFQQLKASQPAALQPTVNVELTKLRSEDLERVGSAPVLTDPKIRALIESNRNRLKSARKALEEGVHPSTVNIAV